MIERWRVSRFVETATGSFAVVIGGVLAAMAVIVWVIGFAVCVAWIAERVG